MSDILMSGFGYTTRDLIRDIVAGRYIVDFGVITKVSGDKTKVDVEHAIQRKILGIQLPATMSHDVEVLWPASAQFSAKFDLAAGDTVLLLGLKDYVKTAKITRSDKTDVPLHYSQANLKALPVGLFNTSASVQLAISGGLVQLKNSSASLYTIVQTLIQGIQGAICVNGNPLTDTTTKIAQSLTQLGQLFKA